MIRRHHWFIFITLLYIFCTGCGLLGPAQKPEVGPQGKVDFKQPNPPLLQRLASPPVQFYDLETKASVLFEDINNQNWSNAQTDITQLQTLWEETKALMGNDEAAKKGDEALNKLFAAISNHKVSDAHESLIQFTGNISDLAKSFKLSPLTDIIAIDNAIRNVSFYVTDKDWKKSAVKAKELESTFGQSKISLEKLGIMSRVTTTHSHINQLKDAVNAENAASTQEHLKLINQNMGAVRDYYRGE